MRYRAMYSYELAAAAGVNRNTFRRWLRADRAELSKFGYAKGMRMIPPGAVRYLCEKYVIVLQ